MSDIRNVFDISGRAMSAQMTRLNTVASNLANVGSMTGSKETAFRALRPVFETEYDTHLQNNGISTVNVTSVQALDREPAEIYRPDHPNANADGFVYEAAVDVDEEMVEMMEASRQYQNNLEVVSTVRQLMARTMSMGK